MLYVDPVSYTHLDVYKRQRADRWPRSFFHLRTSGTISRSWAETSHSHHKPRQFADEFHSDYNVLPTKIGRWSALQRWTTPLYDAPYSHGDYSHTKPATALPLGEWGDNNMDSVTTKGNFFISFSTGTRLGCNLLFDLPS